METYYRPRAPKELSELQRRLKRQKPVLERLLLGPVAQAPLPAALPPTPKRGGRAKKRWPRQTAEGHAFFADMARSDRRRVAPLPLAGGASQALDDEAFEVFADILSISYSTGELRQAFDAAFGSRADDTLTPELGRHYAEAIILHHLAQVVAAMRRWWPDNRETRRVITKLRGATESALEIARDERGSQQSQLGRWQEVTDFLRTKFPSATELDAGVAAEVLLATASDKKSATWTKKRLAETEERVRKRLAKKRTRTAAEKLDRNGV